MTESAPPAVPLRRERTGILNPKAVRSIAFTIITLALVASTVISVLAIWNCVAGDALWRSVATLAVIAIAALFFTIVNERLAP